MGGVEALEQERNEAGARAQVKPIAHLERLVQDVSAARVSIHALVQLVRC